MKTHITSLMWVSLFLSLSVSVVPACINPPGRMSVSEPIYAEKFGPEEFLTALTTHEDKAYWSEALAVWDSPSDRSSDPEGRVERQTNIAVALLHLGKVRRAIKILEELEQTDPGLYYTAANLGTAYELNGENAKALEWIRKGIERNKNSHYGTEWLHVEILEAKLALEKDPNWLATNSVLVLRSLSEQDIRAGHQVAVGNRGKALHMKDVQDALTYQLHERLEFIKPPEGVVADLLFDLSRTLAITRSEEHSATVRAFALTYGSDLTPWPAVEVPPPASMTPYWFGGVFAGIVALAVGIFVLVRRRRKAT